MTKHAFFLTEFYSQSADQFLPQSHTYSAFRFAQRALRAQIRISVSKCVAPDLAVQTLPTPS